jgi:hypothetical protein
MKCPCGETFDSHRLQHTVIHVPHITEAQRALEISPLIDPSLIRIKLRASSLSWPTRPKPTGISGLPLS